jgi:hypothetical protein
MKIKPELQEEYAKYVELNSRDGYSKAVVSFGEAWANLMEELIALGREVKDIAEAASHEADTDGITGYMYGTATSALSHFWIHGDALRAWHNRKYVPEEQAASADESGAVVNPAIVTINL